jgi:hypothetical protein
MSDPNPTFKGGEKIIPHCKPRALQQLCPQVESKGDMTGFLKHISCAILLAASLSASGSAEAAPKYTYLKIGEGGDAQAYAFKSKQARETARRKHTAVWNRMIAKLKKQTRSGGRFAEVPRARCLETLPLGFVRPKRKG